MRGSLSHPSDAWGVSLLAEGREEAQLRATETTPSLIRVRGTISFLLSRFPLNAQRCRFFIYRHDTRFPLQ